MIGDRRVTQNVDEPLHHVQLFPWENNDSLETDTHLGRIFLVITYDNTVSEKVAILLDFGFYLFQKTTEVCSQMCMPHQGGIWKRAGSLIYIQVTK